MHQPDPQKPSQSLHVQLFSDVKRVVVSVPGEDAPFAELSCQLQRRVAFDADDDRCTTILEAARVCDAVELQSGNGQEAGNHFLHHLAFVLMEGGMRSHDRLTPCLARTLLLALASYLFPIIHASFDSSDALVIQRSPFPTVRNVVGVGPHLVRTEFLQMLALAVEHPHMWTEEFVS